MFGQNGMVCSLDQMNVLVDVECSLGNRRLEVLVDYRHH